MTQNKNERQAAGVADKCGGGLWYYGWNVLGAVFSFQAITFGLTFYCFTFWVAPWMQEFNATRSEVLLIIILIQVGMGIGSPFVGHAIDRLSIRLLVVIGILCYAAALALSSMMNSLGAVMLCYGTFIVAGNLLAGSISAQTLVIRWFTANRGIAIGIAAVGTSFGGFVLPPLVTWLLAEYGWRDTNVIIAVSMVLVLVPMVWLVIRNNPRALDLESEPAWNQGELANTRLQATPVFPHWTTKTILKEPAFWILVCALVPITIAFGAFSQNLDPFAGDLGIDAQSAALLVSTMALAMIVGKLFFGTMADRWDHRYLFWIATLLAILAYTILATVTLDYPMMFVVSACAGLSAGSILPLMAAVISSRFGAASFGHISGLIGSFLIVTAIGPWLAAYIRDTQGSYTGAWLLLLCALVPPMIAIAFLPQPPKRQSAIDETGNVRPAIQT